MGNNTICNCNFKQDQPEENLYPNQNQHTINQTQGIPVSTNMMSENFNSGLNTPLSKNDFSQMDYSKSSNIPTSRAKPLTLSKHQESLYTKQKFQIDRDQFVCILKIQIQFRKFFKFCQNFH